MSAATDKANPTILKGKGSILKGGNRIILARFGGCILSPRKKREAVLTEKP